MAVFVDVVVHMAAVARLVHLRCLLTYLCLLMIYLYLRLPMIYSRLPLEAPEMYDCQAT